MTTLTIQLPDSESSIIPTISNLIKKAGGSIIIDNDDLSEAEFAALQEACKEAVLIKEGKLKGIPASDLWND